jgi:branched-chain amino acid transport system substrate-binding protein
MSMINHRGRFVQWRRLVISVVALGLIATACGDDDDDGSGAAPTSEDSGGTATTAAAASTSPATDSTAAAATTAADAPATSGAPATTGGGSEAPSGEPLVIAGLQGEVAEGGPDFMNGMQVAVNEINASGGVAGRPIELRLFETGGTPEGAATAYREAGNDTDVLGAFLGASGALAIRDQSETIGLPIITASGNDAIDIPVTTYVFSNSAGREYATSAIDYAVNKLGAQRIAAIHYGTDFSSQIPDAITGKCEEVGCEIVAIEEAAADAPVDALIPQLTNMRNAEPDVYYLEGLNPNVFAAARQLGIDAPIVSEQWLAVPALRDACGENCAGVTFGIHKCNVPELLQEDDELRQLCEDYRESYLAEYDPWAGFSIYGRDAVYTYAAAVEALLEAGEEPTRENIAAQMEQFDGSLLTTHGAIETSPESHRLTGTWTEGYIDVAIEMQDGQATWVLAPDADPEGSTP